MRSVHLLVPFSVALACGIVAACVGDSSNGPPVVSDSGTPSDGGGATTDGTTQLGDAGQVTTDSGVDAGATDGGAIVDAARCNPTAAFGPAIAVDAVNTSTADDELARLSPDELTLYFSSNRNGGPNKDDIFLTGRLMADASFGAASAVPGVNTTASERAPSVTADGKNLYAMTSPTGGMPFTISVATRASTLSPFSALGPVAVVDDTSASDIVPYVLPDQSALYFTSTRDGGQYEIYRAANASGSYQTPIGISGALINTVNQGAQDAVVTPDELNLYFASSRGDVGSLDMYQSTRATKNDSWGAPSNLVGLNTQDVDVPTWISADNCVLYFTRNTAHDGGTVNYDVFYAVRGP
jgi:Tol biopolymer transport system component